MLNEIPIMINKVHFIPDNILKHNSSFQTVRRISNILPKVYIIWLGLILSTSCSQDEFNIGSGFVESNSSITLIDTFQVELSTVLFDSLETSGDTVMLVGNYSDTLFGRITCNSVFEIGIPEEKYFEENDVFDSLCLILQPTDYFYGDTLQNHSFSIHRLLSDLEKYSDGYLYNTTNVNFESEAMGNYQWFPRPLYTDTVSIRLDDSFGRELFEIYLSSEDFSTISEFLEYFKGLYIQSDTINTNSVIAFNASTVKMRMYYHRFDEYIENLVLDFPINNTDEQFNQIKTDFSTSNYLSEIRLNSNEIKANQTGNLSFMQGGTGLIQKALFPSIGELLNYENGALLKAELEIIPEKTSYQDISLPQRLVLYKTDKYNNFLDIVTDQDGYTVYGTLTYDEFYYENTSYTFNITEYINDQIDNKYFDPNHGLLVVLGSGSLSSNLERLVLSAGTTSPKLKLYYVTYIE